MDRVPDFSSVPHIGDPFECFDPLIIVQARCLCAPENRPFLIGGLNLMVTCQRCKKAYVIQDVHFDRSNGQPVSVSVGCVIAPLGGAN